MWLCYFQNTDNKEKDPLKVQHTATTPRPIDKQENQNCTKYKRTDTKTRATVHWNTGLRHEYMIVY